MLLHDWPKQLSFEPDAWRNSQLERELVACQIFVDALNDDQFAVTAYNYLNWLDWVKVGVPDALPMNGDRSTGAMIAGLRAKGEDYLDYFWNESVIPEAQGSKHRQRLLDILHHLGWHPRDHE